MVDPHSAAYSIAHNRRHTIQNSYSKPAFVSGRVILLRFILVEQRNGLHSESRSPGNPFPALIWILRSSISSNTRLHDHGVLQANVPARQAWHRRLGGREHSLGIEHIRERSNTLLSKVLMSGATTINYMHTSTPVRFIKVDVWITVGSALGPAENQRWHGRTSK